MKFPSTRSSWKDLDALKAGEGPAHAEALENIVRTYGPPLLAFALRRRRSSANEDAEDLVHDFFVRCIEARLFERADRSRGRFRSLLLSSFTHFASNEARSKKAGKRQPSGGMVSLDLLIDQYGYAFDLRTSESPEAVFDRTLRFVTFERAFSQWERVCLGSGDDLKPRAFRAREL